MEAAGHEQVAELNADDGCIMSAANVLEVEVCLRRLGIDDLIVAQAITELPIYAAPFTREMTLAVDVIQVR